jgi:ribonuclease Z
MVDLGLPAGWPQVLRKERGGLFPPLWYDLPMRRSFHARLIHDPFSDPGLFVTFLFRRRAFLFDIGDLQGLSARDLLKVTHVFVTHAHVDHFIGFDHLLRITLGRDKEIHFFGPPGFFGHVEGKLAGYMWNLVGDYPQESTLRVTEVHPEVMKNRVYACRDRFSARGPTLETAFEGTVWAEPALRVDAAFLDHRIPCLGYALAEDFHIKILKERVKEMGLPVGPWLTRFKAALYEGLDLGTEFEVDSGGEGRVRRFTLGELAEKIAMIAPGQKIAYVTDLIGTPENLRKAAQLAEGADHLFVEAGFLERDREKALEKYHLTARDAGELARRARAREFTLFHHSPRYTDRAEELQEEARTAYNRSPL